MVPLLSQPKNTLVSTLCKSEYQIECPPFPSWFLSPLTTCNLNPWILLSHIHFFPPCLGTIMGLRLRFGPYHFLFDFIFVLLLFPYVSFSSNLLYLLLLGVIGEMWFLIWELLFYSAMLENYCCHFNYLHFSIHKHSQIKCLLKVFELIWEIIQIVLHWVNLENNTNSFALF